MEVFGLYLGVLYNVHTFVNVISPLRSMLKVFVRFAFTLSVQTHLITANKHTVQRLST